MMELEQINNVLEEKISSLTLEKSQIKIINLELLNSIIEKINLVINNINNLKDVTDEDLKLLSSFIGENDIKIIKVYKECLKNDLFDFKDIYVNKTKEICNMIILKYNEYKKSLESNNKKIILFDKEIEKIRNLKQKISINSYLDENDIDYLLNILNSSNIDKKDIINLMIFVCSRYIKLDEHKIKNSKNHEPILREDLFSLFSKYNIDLNNFDNDSIEEILKHGDLQNIEEILKILENNKIILTKEIINEKSMSLAKIFIYSSPNNVKSLIELSKKMGKFDFKTLIETPSVFISKRRKVIRNSKGPFPSFQTDVVGRFEDFKNNVELLYQKYKKVVGDNRFVENVFNRCDETIYTVSNQRLLKSIEMYELYGISPVSYLTSLAGVMYTNQADFFDIALELDCFDYIKDNMYQVTNATRNKFDKIAIAKNEGYSNYDIFRKQNKNTLLGIKASLVFNDKYVTGLTTGKRFEKFSLEKSFDKNELIIFKEIENIIQSSENGGIYLSEKELQDEESTSILKELEKYVDSNNNLVYNFNGILISRLKVLRLYNTLRLSGIEENFYSIIYILIRGSYLTQEQFNSISDLISRLEKEKENRL